MDCKHTINANPQQQLLRRCFSLDAVHKTFYINDKKQQKSVLKVVSLMGAIIEEGALLLKFSQML